MVPPGTKWSTQAVASVNNMAECDDRAPLLAEEGGIRQRGSSLKEDEPTEKTWTLPPGSDYDPDLPYGGKVYMARKKKPDPLHVRVIEVRRPTPVR